LTDLSRLMYQDYIIKSANIMCNLQLITSVIELSFLVTVTEIFGTGKILT